MFSRFLVVLFWIWASNAHAQTPFDSLTIVFNEASTDEIKFSAANQISRSMAFKDPSIAENFGKKAIHLAINMGDSSALAEARMNLAVAYHVQGKLETAVSIYQTVWAYRIETHDSIGLSGVLNNLGAAYTALGNAPRALEVLNQSFELKKALGQLDRTITTLSNIGNIYYEQGNLTKALDYYQQSLEISAEVLNESGMSRAYNNMGLTFLKQKNPDSALYYYLLSNDIVSVDAPCQRVFVLDGLSQAYFDLGNYELAKQFADQLLLLSVDCQEQEKTSSALTILGRIYLETDNSLLGEKYLKEAFEKSKQVHYRQNLVDVSHLLYGLYKKQNQSEKALQMLEIYSAENDSLKDLKQTEALTRVAMQYEFDQELDSIAYQQQLADQSYRQTLSKERYTQRLLAVGLLVLFMLAVILFVYYRNKSKINKLLASKNKQIQKALDEREVLMREIHHRVKNNMQIVSSLLNIQSKLTEHPDAKSALEEGRDRVLTMAMIHQKLYQSDDLSHIDLKDYVHDIAQSVFESMKTEDKNIALKLTIERQSLELDQMISIGLIINELITNSLKHAFQHQVDGWIRIAFISKEKNYVLEIEDNGEYEPNGISNNSYGLRLIQSLSRSLNAELTITHPGGTQTTLQIPKT